jgi:hypothetical protein
MYMHELLVTRIPYGLLMRGIPDQSVREPSRAAFGQRYRLECMVAIANSESGKVSLGELAAQLRVTASNLQAPRRSLVETGLLQAESSSEPGKRIYGRVDSAAWDWARELAERASAR